MPSTILRNKLLAFSLAFLGVSATGCGGGSSTPCSGVNCGGSGGGGGGGLTAQNPVTVTANNATTGVNINVATPASTTVPNVEFLGADGTGNAYPTGDFVLVGSTANVLVFGAGLTSTMQISFSGPADIAVGTPQSITATDGTPGLQFAVSVDPAAAFGARTLILQSPNNDVTTLAGGLEVQ
ncbi:MAG: hypothetical protein M3O09_09485 [Acidobacteriota bacterium]|nr:hypothetical protein [Acidobacteriota bacterium]